MKPAKRSRERTRDESCLRKQAHDTFEEAERHAVNVKGAVYRCGFCSRFHVTRQKNDRRLR